MSDSRCTHEKPNLPIRRPSLSHDQRWKPYDHAQLIDVNDDPSDSFEMSKSPGIDRLGGQHFTQGGLSPEQCEQRG
ncbi:MAG: hypothetical protein GY758_19130 [Fuerstiella sp.]|nr:hypothetical protein [Fuerstiella sp.]